MSAVKPVGSSATAMMFFVRSSSDNEDIARIHRECVSID
ncbi:MAG: hypothetical protein OJF51_004483 [Nitrospira sp.]|nr:MAG: hypothetical protein OJF51_004483 [Nitrospira sp.]